MRLVTIYPPHRVPVHVTASECRSCRFAAPTTTGRLACRSLLMEVRPDWACRDFQPGGDAAVAAEEPELAVV